MGITRDDLVYDVGRHVDDSVHLFEEWGLPIWKEMDGGRVDGANWQKQGGKRSRTAASRCARAAGRS